MTAKPRATRVDVAVLGAGLTGMSAAYHLRAAGVSCRVFEREARPGGHAVTIEDSGYRFDRTGHLLHLKDDALEALARSWMGPDHQRVARKSAVWSHGVYTRYPFQANAFGLPPAVAFECVMGFVRASQSPAPAPANFEEYCLTTFGKGISEHFMIPYNSRLWGVSPREISAEWCQRFVPVPSLEDVIAGAVGLGDRELGYNVSFLYPTRGIGQLSDGLAAALGDVELEKNLRSIDGARRELCFDDEVVSYQHLVSTIPLPPLVRLCGDAPPNVVAAAARLRCTHLHYLDVALSEPAGQPYHWIYVPEERYPFYRVGCYSHFSSAMAPRGGAGLYVELVDRREPDVAELMPRVTAALCEMGIVRDASAVAFVRPRRIDYAYVVFDHDYYPALAAIRPFLAARGIVSTGRYGGWNYSSMGDALAYGREAAQQILARRAEGQGG
jgi:protoporphyrinogen oxidase